MRIVGIRQGQTTISRDFCENRKIGEIVVCPLLLPTAARPRITGVRAGCKGLPRLDLTQEAQDLRRGLRRLFDLQPVSRTFDQFDEAQVLEGLREP